MKRIYMLIVSIFSFLPLHAMQMSNLGERAIDNLRTILSVTQNQSTHTHYKRNLLGLSLEELQKREDTIENTKIIFNKIPAAQIPDNAQELLAAADTVLADIRQIKQTKYDQMPFIQRLLYSKLFICGCIATAIVVGYIGYKMLNKEIEESENQPVENDHDQSNKIKKISGVRATI